MIQQKSRQLRLDIHTSQNQFPSLICQNLPFTSCSKRLPSFLLPTTQKTSEKSKNNNQKTIKKIISVTGVRTRVVAVKTRNAKPLHYNGRHH